MRIYRGCRLIIFNSNLRALRTSRNEISPGAVFTILAMKKRVIAVAAAVTWPVIHPASRPAGIMKGEEESVLPFTSARFILPVIFSTFLSLSLSHFLSPFSVSSPLREPPWPLAVSHRWLSASSSFSSSCFSFSFFFLPLRDRPAEISTELRRRRARCSGYTTAGSVLQNKPLIIELIRRDGKSTALYRKPELFVAQHSSLQGTSSLVYSPHAPQRSMQCLA